MRTEVKTLTRSTTPERVRMRSEARSTSTLAGNFDLMVRPGPDLVPESRRCRRLIIRVQ